MSKVGDHDLLASRSALVIARLVVIGTSQNAPRGRYGRWTYDVLKGGGNSKDPSVLSQGSVNRGFQTVVRHCRLSRG